VRCLGQVFRCVPHRLDLFVDQRAGFRRNVSVGQPLADHRWVHRRVLQLPPELEPAISSGFSHGIDRDPHQPSIHAGVTAKRVPILVGAPEAFLGQSFGGVPVAHTSHDKSEDTRPVELHDTVEVLDLGGGTLHA